MSKVRVGIPKLLHNGHLGAPEMDTSPNVMEEGGHLQRLEEWPR